MSTSTGTGSTTLPHGDKHICLIGLGAIGVSFLALHLTYTSARVSVYDPRPDLQEHLESVLPLYLPSDPSSSSTSTSVSGLLSGKRLVIHSDLASAVRDATIVQEQGPEHLPFKQSTWSEVIKYASPATHLWSSTSGIPASRQLSHLSHADAAKSKLLIVHPFNPPHIMPLLELVPSPDTATEEVEFAREYFASLGSGHRPITIHKESQGFVANRLSFIMFREACHLVNEGVASAEEVDEIVRASLGPRWAVAGPFKMYAFGGGKKGMAGFLDNIGESIDGVWKDAGNITMAEQGWKKAVVEQTDRSYGTLGPDEIRARDEGLKRMVKLQEDLTGGKSR